MCDMCGTSDTEGKYQSAPNTPERMAEIQEQEKERILEFGHQINGIEADPMFYYTSGRCVFDRPELLLTGNLPPETASYILNTLGDMDSAKVLDLAALASDSLALAEPYDFGGAPFGCAFKFIRIDPIRAEMFGATNIGGPFIAAIQILWPDAEGRWPDDPDFAYGSDAQPIHSM